MVLLARMGTRRVETAEARHHRTAGSTVDLTHHVMDMAQPSQIASLPADVARMQRRGSGPAFALMESNQMSWPRWENTSCNRASRKSSRNSCRIKPGHG
jgi:hypothetical protein